MCFGCRRLGFVEPSPPPDPEDDREDEEQPQPQPQQLDRPARRKKLLPLPKTIVHPAPSHDGIPAFVAYSVPADTPEDADLTLLRPAYAYDDEAPPLYWDKIAFEMLGKSALISSRYGVRSLYEHFLPGGAFDFEREKAHERGADDVVDLPM
ncbi:hypothetical protein LZ30DRAFT_589928 [Colletotrichum cereale]|nr:hypothetical protein LZ30DRAFT_589928 [Colletotrichum cereale]